MLSTYQALAQIALDEFGVHNGGVVANATFVGGTPSDPNKLRLFLSDDSFIDVWLSLDGDYACHWEQRRQRGRIYRWDNAPHYPQVNTFPDHLHNEQESTVVESHLSSMTKDALRQVLAFVTQHLVIG
jgi:hypothetical protein